MALHRLVTIDGKRHDITGKVISYEHTCDSCGEFTEALATAVLPGVFLPGETGPTGVELCERCVYGKYPGLVDLAGKVASRA